MEVHNDHHAVLEGYVDLGVETDMHPAEVHDVHHGVYELYEDLVDVHHKNHELDDGAKLGLFHDMDLVVADRVLLQDKELQWEHGCVPHRHAGHQLCILLCRFYLQQLYTPSHTCNRDQSILCSEIIFNDDMLGRLNCF